VNLIEIRNGKWVLEVDLDGGRIFSLVKDDQKILGTFKRIDGKNGNTHICVPNFANEGVEKFGFIFHGPFRNEKWNLVSQGQNSLEISCEVGGLKVSQNFLLDDEFVQNIKIENTSNKRKRVNLAMHNYWDTGAGWQGIKLNGVDITKGIKNNPEVKLREENLLEIPGKKSIVWKVNNFKLAKLWTGFKEENGKQIFDQKYVCIEPEMEFEGFVETKESWLDADEKIVFNQSINLE
jgi:hypothetical protein